MPQTRNNSLKTNCMHIFRENFGTIKGLLILEVYSLILTGYLQKTNRPEICSSFPLPLQSESLKIIQESMGSCLPQSLPHLFNNTNQNYLIWINYKII